MKRLKVFRNQDVKKIYIGPPKGHKHLRLIIETEEEILVFQEATLAAITRGYTYIKTHPIRKTIKMEGHVMKRRKEGYAEYQLLETEADDEEIMEEITRIVNP